MKSENEGGQWKYLLQFLGKDKGKSKAVPVL
jgi:hypothetical protein